jgi:hypothetical protein
VTDEFRKQEQGLGTEAAAGGRPGAPDDVQAQQTLRLRKLKQRKVEFDLLYYAFNGVRLTPRYFVQHVTLVLRRGNYR